MDCEPDGPSRAAGKRVAAEHLPQWATEQAKLVANSGSDLLAKIRTAPRVVNFGGDALPLAGALVRGVPMNVDDIANVMMKGEEIVSVYVHEYTDADRNKAKPVITDLRMDQYNPFIRTYGIGEIDLSVNLMERFEATSEREFWVIIDDNDIKVGTFVDYLRRAVECKGGSFEIRSEERSVGTYIGKASDRDGLVPGAEVLRNVAVFTARHP